MFFEIKPEQVSLPETPSLLCNIANPTAHGSEPDIHTALRGQCCPMVLVRSLSEVQACVPKS